MPRRTHKGRTKLQYRMSFKRMCQLAGIKPVQRVKLMKLIEQNLKQEEVSKTSSE